MLSMNEKIRRFQEVSHRAFMTFYEVEQTGNEDDIATAWERYVETRRKLRHSPVGRVYHGTNGSLSQWKIDLIRGILEGMVTPS